MSVGIGAWRTPPALTGSLVRLEPLMRDHAVGLAAAAADPRIWEWTLTRLTGDVREMVAWTDEALAGAAAGRLHVLTVLSAGGRVLGSTRMMLAPADRHLEIGYTWYVPQVWRTGVNVEAKLLLLTHAFERLGCVRVELVTDALNARSRGAIEALGCSLEGIMRRHRVTHSGRIRDTAMYSLLDDEWPSARSRLEERVARHRAQAPPEA